jgi:hypothetical protein
MKTLIIHPDDRSTDFLRAIYQNIEHDQVVAFHVSKTDLHAMIKAHDRIIMLGHGSPSGLFNIAGGGYLIGAQEVEVLRDKQLIAIWCHADKFMERHQLPGLYSGMFISEVSEAHYYDIQTTQAEVNESNDTFARVLGAQLTECLDDGLSTWRKVREQYTELAQTNVIAEYNSSRWYYNSRQVLGIPKEESYI